jgi:hypothetical protein
MKDKTWLAKHKYSVQALAFCLIMAPPVGLYYTVTLGWIALTWILVALIVAGMLLALWAT